MWTRPDEDLIKQGIAELEALDLVRKGSVEGGYEVRMPKAYPTHDQYYKRNVEIMREWLGAHAKNVYPVGRNVMHRYNNADHSMLTAMLTVENILDGTDHDVWTVNVEEEYHEEKSPLDQATGSGERGTGRDAPIIPPPLIRTRRKRGLRFTRRPRLVAQPVIRPGIRGCRPRRPTPTA
jgi:hypothetical protein